MMIVYWTGGVNHLNAVMAKAIDKAISKRRR